MSMPAFYLPAGEWQKKPRLTGDEARHAFVLRVRPGDELMILDGQGKSGVCRITGLDRKSIELELLREWLTDPPQTRAIMALALSKAVRRGFFMEKSAELGAWEVWLWQAARSQGHLDEKLINACAGQLRAGAKQCRNPWFPKIRICGDAKTVAREAQNAAWRLMPWEVRAGQPIIAASELARPGDTVFAIGPEGGITEEEAGEFMAAGFQPVSLGERVFRCETAAVLCLSLHWWAARSRHMRVE